MNRVKILNKLIELGYYISRTNSSKEELIEFINLLKPMDIGIPLVRLGSPNDGGYLVPDDLEGLTTLLSPGVSSNSDFEFDLAEKGLNCFLADFSVDGPAIQHPNFHFYKKFISSEDDKNGIFISLDNFFLLAKAKMENMSKAPSDLDFILSMDIEGDELDVLLNTSEKTLDSFRIIVMEIHDLQRVFHRPLLVLYRTLIKKLLKNFIICHIHPNNGFKPVINNGIDMPPLLEITLINKKRVSELAGKKLAQIPNVLDTKTVPNNPDIYLSNLYY